MEPLKGVFTLEPQIKGEFYFFAAREEMIYQEKEVIPSENDQIIIPDGIKNCLSRVVVKRIPSNYGKITYDGERMIIE